MPLGTAAVPFQRGRPKEADVTGSAEARPAVRLRPCTPHDVAALSRTCLLTGDSGRDASALTDHPDLVGDVYATPYAVHDPGLVTVVEDDGGVAGYVIGCRDTAAFERWRETSWWPPLRARYPAPDHARPYDAALLRIVHGGASPATDPPDLLERFPAHLHIDLLPRIQGGGTGRRLIEHLERQLRAAGVPGVHLGVSALNSGAIAFYRRLGFTELAATEGGYVLGRSLAP